MPVEDVNHDPLSRRFRRSDWAAGLLSAARGLALTCHPLPTLAVTALITSVAAASGQDLLRCLLVAATVLSGQLFIGWYNDLLDRGRDRAVGRTDKPLVTGAVTPAQVRTACALTLACCVPLSFANGWRSGLAHLIAVASGWAYDAGLKGTVWSALPYAVCFGSLMGFVSYAGSPPGPPSPLVTAAAALLGVGAHLTNVVPDLTDDAATGVRGLPHRLGARASVVLSAAAFVAGVALVLVDSPDPTSPERLVLGGVAAVLVGLAVVTGGASAGSALGRWPFRCAIGVGTTGVALLLLRGGVR